MSHLNFPTPAVLVVFTFENIIGITLVQPVFILTMNFELLRIFIAVMILIVFLLSCFWMASKPDMVDNKQNDDRKDTGRDGDRSN
jgi:hypothetical protein